MIAFYIRRTQTPPEGVIKKVAEIIDQRSFFNDELYRFLYWMAEYYMANIGDVLNAALPPEIRRKPRPEYFMAANIPDDICLRDIPPDVKDVLRPGKKINLGTVEKLRREFKAEWDKMVLSGVIDERWKVPEKSEHREKVGYCLGNKASDEPLTSLINEVAAGDGVFQKNSLLEKGISAYRFGRWLKDEAIVPAYKETSALAFIQPRPDVETLVPNREQTTAISRIDGVSGKFHPFLLYGITGSGKTLVYCHTARQAVASGRSVLVLVPEIALAGTLLAYFRSYFGGDVAIWHSALGARERLDVWQGARSGKYKIVIGARSAIFAPLSDLGLIIVDEEHDESFKQDDPSPRFQGRDAAVMRAKLAGIPVVLGSATPSLESFHNARTGRYELLKLTRRPEEVALPVTRMVDLRREIISSEKLFFTPTMISRIGQALEQNHQVIIYFNRRGFSPRLKCGDCGHTPTCPSCGIALSYHKSGPKLLCHFCGYTVGEYNRCPACQSGNLVYLGTGTQKIEEVIAQLFPSAKPLRLDSDSASGKEKVHHFLADFASGRYDILVGTQMVTKGIDFPRVSVVGILLADMGLDLPDFRASEKLFARLIQVSGRSGRGIIPGEVIIQTFSPDKDIIDDAARQDYETFFEREIESRRALSYPPFTRLVNFRISANKENEALKFAVDFREALREKLIISNIKAHLLGPAPSPYPRLRGMYRRQLLLKTRQITGLVRMLSEWETSTANFGLPSRVKVVVDIDAYDMM